MNQAKTTWGAGEYPLMAQALEPASARVIDAVNVSAGQRVIDVATGTGNAALLAAERGAHAIGIDTEPALLALARHRASADLDVEWIEGDVEALPVADGHADVVLSVFGAMYALDHAAAAQELVRVLAPRGRLALVAWTPGSVMPELGGVIAGYLPPPPPASGPPADWGDPETLRVLLKDAGATIHLTTVSQLTLHFDGAPSGAAFLIRTAGHIVSHQHKLQATGRWHRLRDELASFVADRGEQHADKLSLRLDYLLAVAGHT
jgi:SAM-dependent methyltransferase